MNKDKRGVSYDCAFRSSVSFASTTYLGILVCLGTKEWLSIRHFDRLLGSLFESLKVTQVSLWVDKSATNRVGVASDGSDNANSSILCLLHVIEKQIHQEKVSEMVDALFR